MKNDKAVLDDRSFTIYDELLNTTEAAKYLSLSPGSVRNLCSEGKLRHYKMGNRNRYLLEDLRRFSLPEPRGGLEWE